MLYRYQKEAIQRSIGNAMHAASYSRKKICVGGTLTERVSAVTFHVFHVHLPGSTGIESCAV